MEEKTLGKKNADVKISTLLGQGAEINGDFNAKGSARLDGKVNGNVNVSGTLILGAGSVINGDLTADIVIIGGEIVGNVNAPTRTELTGTARVLGDITTNIIVIDEHAVFQGRCDMNQEVPDRKTRSNTAKAIRAGRKTAKAAIAEALKEVEEEAMKEEQSTGGEESTVSEQGTAFGQPTEQEQNSFSQGY